MISLDTQYNVPVIDMTAMTTALYTDLYNNGGADATAALHCYSDVSHSSIDNTHLSAYGAEKIAGMIADETDRLTLKIAENLK